MSKINAFDFFNAWVEATEHELIKPHLISAWTKSKDFSNCILRNEEAVVKHVANKLGLLHYNEYYSIDSVFFQQEDKVPDLNPAWTFLRRIHIAFEHENSFKSGLYQEASHLLITNCDLRVLVTYPDDTWEYELKKLHNIISGSRDAEVIAKEKSFIIIFGENHGSTIKWEGYIYGADEWELVSSKDLVLS